MNKKLGLPSVIAIGVGEIVATSCLMSVGQGTSFIGLTFIISMAIACILNMLFALSASEMNGLMPNLTGGLPEYTLACMGRFVTILIMVGGYIFGSTIVGSVECAMFGNTIKTVFPNCPLSAGALSISMLIILTVTNLCGIDLFSKIQNFVAYGLIISLVILGFTGVFKLGTGIVVIQPAVVSSSFADIFPMCGMAVFCFIASEYILPFTKDMKNPKRDVPLGMILSLAIIFVMQSMLSIGFSNYVLWEDLGSSASPHIMYGTYLLGTLGTFWMGISSLFEGSSTANTPIALLAGIVCAMSEIELLPKVFVKRNKKKVPYFGVLLIAAIMLVINITGLTETEEITFIILVSSIFMLLAYIVVHINVIIMRIKQPKAERTFKVPGGIVLPCIGIVGIIAMIFQIDPDPSVRASIYMVCGLVALVIGIYAFIWIKIINREKLFKPMSVEEVYALENQDSMEKADYKEVFS